MTEPTTSTRTFVFTDIEGSTRLLRELGSDYRRVLREHDRLITEVTEEHGGEIFGSEGDAQNLVFDDPLAAVVAAAEAQRRLAAHPWPEGHPLRVRMGAHSGEVHRDASGFVGLALHETARISAAAHGGQVLLSPTTAEQVRARLPHSLALRDLGEHELRDIEGARRLHQLDIEGLAQEFPAPRARALARTSLPRPVTSFIEREEVEAIVDLAAGTRLLTLTGPGGTGKTRLAIAAAERLTERYRDGTWFVPLDAVYEPELVIPQIVTTLGIGSGSEPPLEQLIAHLRDRSVLLVLDNLEQVVAAGVAVGQVLAQCSHVSVLATSRIPLRIYGEQEYPVPALPLPDRAGGSTSAQDEVASVRLFEERARAAKPSFRLTDDNRPDVAEIVARLDGLPLAIELAAARVKTLPASALRQRLDDRLATLTGGARDLPRRQRTLRGAIAWSHDLLDEADCRLFARLGVFAGSVSVPQVEAVAGPVEEVGRDVFDGLESLVEQSLLRVVDSDEDEPRFGMLATIREFARERLLETGEAARIQRRHAQAYLALAEEAEPMLLGRDAAAWNDCLEIDHDDLRAALDWTVANDEAELGLRLIIALWRFWQVRGHLYEADDRVHAVLAMPSVESQPAVLRARAELAAGGVTYWMLQEETTHRHYQAALGLARATDDRALLAECLYNAGFASYVSWRRSGQEQVREATAAYFEEALAIYLALDDRGGIARTSWSLALQAAAGDDVDRARELVRDSLAASRSIGDTYHVGWALHTLGQSDVAVGDLAAASRHLRESLDIWVASGDMSAVSPLLIDAVVVGRARGDEACSWRLIGAEERLRHATGTGQGEAHLEFPALEPRRAPETDEERSWVAEGRTLTTDEAIRLAREIAFRD